MLWGWSSTLSCSDISDWEPWTIVDVAVVGNYCVFVCMRLYCLIDKHLGQSKFIMIKRSVTMFAVAEIIASIILMNKRQLNLFQVNIYKQTNYLDTLFALFLSLKFHIYIYVIIISWWQNPCLSHECHSLVAWWPQRSSKVCPRSKGRSAWRRWIQGFLKVGRKTWKLNEINI